MISYLAIAGGGAAGALLRHGVNQVVTSSLGTSFPWGIFICNIAGSFLMGVLIALFAHMWDAPPAIKLFLTTGCLGAFTTFSTFSLDAITLIERGNFGAAGFYITGSVVLALISLFAGLHIVRIFT